MTRFDFRRFKRLFERTSRTALHALSVSNASRRVDCTVTGRSAGKRQADVINFGLPAETE